jgi:hypothetical protein
VPCGAVAVATPPAGCLVLPAPPVVGGGWWVVGEAGARGSAALLGSAMAGAPTVIAHRLVGGGR